MLKVVLAQVPAPLPPPTLGRGLALALAQKGLRPLAKGNQISESTSIIAVGDLFTYWHILGPFLVVLMRPVKELTKARHCVAPNNLLGEELSSCGEENDEKEKARFSLWIIFPLSSVAW